eukprot:9897724-Lingulodinium_polyedra.AAC.1
MPLTFTSLNALACSLYEGFGRGPDRPTSTLTSRLERKPRNFGGARRVPALAVTTRNGQTYPTQTQRS